MKNFYQRDGHDADTRNSSKSTDTKRRKNMKRLGGGGLSLQTFANMKSKNSHYNPALIKQQKEFYKNAKYVSKFKKTMKQHTFSKKYDTGEGSKVDDDDDDDKLKGKPHSFHEEDQTGESSRKVNDDYKHKGKFGKRIGLEEVYKQTREEMDKARMEREAAFQAKKAAKEEAESRRKAAKEKMRIKTRHGQPVMKYRIEQLLESIKKTAEIDRTRTA